MSNSIQHRFSVKFYEQSLFREIVEPSRLMWAKEHDYKYKTPDRWEKLTTKQFYMRPRTLGMVWGAYLLPDDIQIGERVHVEELIEDIHLNGNTLAADGIAVWTGDSKFEPEHWDKIRERRHWVVG